VLATAMTSACTDTPASRQDGGASSWEDYAHFSVRSAIYAPSFLSESSEGKFLRVSLHPDALEQACGLYRTGTTDREVRFLRISTNHYQDGTFNVVEGDTTGDGPQATARVIRALGSTKLAAYPASQGQLEVSNLPDSIEEWRLGRAIHISGLLQFSPDPVVENMCSEAIPVDPALEASASCTCTHASRSVTECVPQDLAGNCCRSVEPFSIAVNVDAIALPCPELCVTTDPGLTRICAALSSR